MADKGVLRLLALAGMLLFIPGQATAELGGRGMKPLTQAGKTFVQEGEAAQANKQLTYLNLEVKIGKGGSVEVMRAAELPGTVRLNSAPTSDYIYEVSHGRHTVAVAFLRDDPFVVRGFADPSSPQGENIGRQESTTIIINIPAFGLSMLSKRKLGLRLYRLRSGVKGGTLDTEAFLKLRAERSLIIVLSVPASKFTESIRKAAKAKRQAERTP